MLETLGTIKENGIEKDLGKLNNYGMEKKDELGGESGQIQMMRYR